MIKTNKGKIAIEGNPLEVLSDLSLIVHCLYEDIFVKDVGIPEDEAKELIMRAVKTGFIPPEELRKQNEADAEKLSDVLDKAISILEKILKEGEDE